MDPSYADAPIARRGLTLVEMLIVVVIVGIAAALAVPMFSESSDIRLRSAASVLVADLDAARIDSIANADDPRVVVFDTAVGSYHVAAASAPATPLTNTAVGGNWQVVYGQGTAARLDGVGLQSVSLGGDSTLTFGAFGNLDESADATIELAAGTLRITVTVDAATGEATVGPITTP
ncbi:MAG: prepilin-type N-terminal cleavage/methylation domain-containing protein [Planctomycetota bacterium]